MNGRELERGKERERNGGRPKVMYRAMKINVTCLKICNKNICIEASAKNRTFIRKVIEPMSLTLSKWNVNEKEAYNNNNTGLYKRHNSAKLFVKYLSSIPHTQTNLNSLSFSFSFSVYQTPRTTCFLPPAKSFYLNAINMLPLQSNAPARYPIKIKIILFQLKLLIVSTFNFWKFIQWPK